MRGISYAENIVRLEGRTGQRRQKTTFASYLSWAANKGFSFAHLSVTTILWEFGFPGDFRINYCKSNAFTHLSIDTLVRNRIVLVEMKAGLDRLVKREPHHPLDPPSLHSIFPPFPFKLALKNGRLVSCCMSTFSTVAVLPFLAQISCSFWLRHASTLLQQQLLFYFVSLSRSRSRFFFSLGFNVSVPDQSVKSIDFDMRSRCKLKLPH